VKNPATYAGFFDRTLTLPAGRGRRVGPLGLRPHPTTIPKILALNCFSRFSPRI
jgi:hypothetical protein